MNGIRLLSAALLSSKVKQIEILNYVSLSLLLCIALICLYFSSRKIILMFCQYFEKKKYIYKIREKMNLDKKQICFKQ